MVDLVVTKQELIDAQKDAQALDDIVNKGPEVHVKTRLGRYVWTLATLEQRSLLQINEWQNAITLITANDGVPALAVADAGGKTQQEINDFGGAEWRNKPGGYKLGATVKLENGDTVKSTVADNVINPNVDMVGWELADAAINATKLNRELISIWDFFNKQELADYKSNPTGFDAHRPLQEFFNHVKVNKYAKGDITGEFATSKGIIVGDAATTTLATKVIFGNLKLTALGVIDVILDWRSGQDVVLMGNIQTDGIGSHTSLADTRVCRIGVYFRNNCNRLNVFGTVTANKCYEQGVIAGNKSIGLLLKGGVQCFDCGTGHYPNSTTLRTIISKTNSGTSGGLTQKTSIVVDSVPAFAKNATSTVSVLIGNQMYMVDNINENTIEVFPWVDSSNTDTQLRFAIGGAFRTESNDNASFEVAKLVAQRCASVVDLAGLYGGIFNNVIAEYNLQGVIFGGSRTAGLVGGQFNELYIENTMFNIVRRTNYTLNTVFIAPIGLNLDNVCYQNAPRATNDTLSTGYATLKGFAFIVRGQALTFEKNANNGENANTSHIFDIFEGKNISRSYRKTAVATTTVNLTAPNTNLQHFGYDSGVIRFSGVGSNGQYGGTINFTAPDGYNMIGTDFSGFIRPAEFLVQYIESTKTFYASLINDAITRQASLVYDPPSLAAAGTSGDSVTTNVTLTGVAVGDNVSAAFNKYNAAIDITYQVSAANTVTVKFKNTSATAVDLPSGTLTVKKV